MAGKGTGYFAKRARERRAEFSNPYLFLSNDGDTARIRFLEEPKEGLFSGVFHRPYTKGKGLSNPILCVERDNDVPDIEGMTDKCPLCTQDDKPGLKFFLYVYVYHILHPLQNPALAKDASAPKWKAVKVGKGEDARTMFKQDVNKVKVLLGGAQMQEKVTECEAAAAEEDGDSLLASDYKLIRHGVKGDSDTTYVFRAIKKSGTLKDEVKEAIDKLGDITDIALEGTIAFYTKEQKEDEPVESEEPEEAEDAEDEAKPPFDADEEEAEEEEPADKDFATL